MIPPVKEKRLDRAARIAGKALEVLQIARAGIAGGLDFHGVHDAPLFKDQVDFVPGRAFVIVKLLHCQQAQLAPLFELGQAYRSLEPEDQFVAASGVRFGKSSLGGE